MFHEFIVIIASLHGIDIYLMAWHTLFDGLTKRGRKRYVYMTDKYEWYENYEMEVMNMNNSYWMTHELLSVNDYHELECLYDWIWMDCEW